MDCMTGGTDESLRGDDTFSRYSETAAGRGHARHARDAALDGVPDTGRGRGPGESYRGGVDAPARAGHGPLRGGHFRRPYAERVGPPGAGYLVGAQRLRVPAP